VQPQGLLLGIYKTCYNYFSSMTTIILAPKIDAETIQTRPQFDNSHGLETFITLAQQVVFGFCTYSVMILSPYFNNRLQLLSSPRVILKHFDSHSSYICLALEVALQSLCSH